MAGIACSARLRNAVCAAMAASAVGTSRGVLRS